MRKLANIRLHKDPDKSFIIYKENEPFSEWHHHPEYELVFITKGRGKRMVGDHISRFAQNDLVFLGAYTPHEWLCDPEFFDKENGFQGEGIVIQFLYDFLGKQFFDVDENNELKQFLSESKRGLEFFGSAKTDIIRLVYEILGQRKFDKLHTLFSIFKVFANTEEFRTLSSQAYSEPYWENKDTSMQHAMQYILQNFNRPISVGDMMKVTNMSNSSFYAAFKKTYRMSFKDYLMRIRVGHACRLLGSFRYNISEIAFECGFDNLSNFNRQFKKLKGITPTTFQENFRRERRFT